MLGDVDGDGQVGIVDATFIQRHLAGIRIPFAERVESVGNVSNSGTLDIIDATAIQYWLAGRDTPYSVSSLME